MKAAMRSVRRVRGMGEGGGTLAGSRGDRYFGRVMHENAGQVGRSLL